MGRTDKNQKTKHSILCCDPSMTAYGWSIIDWDGNWVDGGCIQTKKENKLRNIRKGDDDVRRVSEINRELLEKINTYKVSFMIAELPSGTQSAAAATMLGMAKGLTQTIGDSLQVPIEWFSEGDSKKAALGKISATKQEMIDAMGKLYNVRWGTYKNWNEAVADATAMHNCAMKLSPILKLKQNGL